MLALQAPPLFGPGETVSVQAEVSGVDAPIQVEVLVTPVSGLTEPIKVQAEVGPGAPAALRVGDLAPGLYRITLRSHGHLAQRPDPVQSLFEVVDAAAMEIITDIA